MTRQSKYSFTFVGEASALPVAVRAFENASWDCRVFGGVICERGSALWHLEWNKPPLIYRLWYSFWLLPLRYLVTLRVRLIRRPLRTGKILGVTIMSYLDQPEKTRLP
jgi:hypothetical protein